MMIRSTFVAATVVFAIGCGGGSSGEGDAPAHHHHGAEESGPNGGHLIELDKPAYRAEWLHDNASGTITVIVLDAKAEKEVAVAADHATITVHLKTADGNTPKTYQLTAVARSGDPSASSRFELKDRELLTHLGMPGEVANKFAIEIDGQTYFGDIEHHHH